MDGGAVHMIEGTNSGSVMSVGNIRGWNKEEYEPLDREFINLSCIGVVRQQGDVRSFVCRINLHLGHRLSASFESFTGGRRAYILMPRGLLSHTQTGSSI